MSKSKFSEFEKCGSVLKNYAHILELLLRLRQACDHPQLVLSSNTRNDSISLTQCHACFECVEDAILTNCNHVICVECNEKFLLESKICPTCSEVVTSSEVYNNQIFHNDYSIGENKNFLSTKINALLYELHQTHQNLQMKSIIFSQWTSMLDLLEKPLKEAGYQFVRLDGSMSQAQRENSLNQFNSNPETKIFLISMRAGGLGLNLTAASNVFLLDPWWNPATEDQAIDRVHRIGQNKPVSVTRFIIDNSIEEKILLLQEKKRKLADGALNEVDCTKIKLDELNLLFKD